MSRPKKNIEEPIEIKIHIYDFLNTCKITRNIHQIFLKQFESKGLKTFKEWELITGLKTNQ